MNVSEEIVGKVSSAFNFSVDKFPLTGPEGMRTPFYGLFRSDNGAVVGKAVTSRYVPHQTDDIIALVEAASVAFEGVADVKCHFRDGHYVAIQPSKEYRKAIFGTKDNIFPRAILDAGYDGKSFRGNMGYWRDLCNNMAIMRSVKSTSVCIRHTSGLRPKLNELIETFSILKESWGTLAAVVESLESRRVNMVEFLNAVYGEPDANSPRSVTMHKHRTEAIFRRLHSERLRSGRPEMQSDWMVSGWEAYNAVQGFTQHEGRRHGKVSEMDRIVMAANDASVQRAEEIVMAMAA